MCNVYFRGCDCIFIHSNLAFYVYTEEKRSGA